MSVRTGGLHRQRVLIEGCTPASSATPSRSMRSGRRSVRVTGSYSQRAHAAAPHREPGRGRRDPFQRQAAAPQQAVRQEQPPAVGRAVVERRTARQCPVSDRTPPRSPAGGNRKARVQCPNRGRHLSCSNGICPLRAPPINTNRLSPRAFRYMLQDASGLLARLRSRGAASAGAVHRVREQGVEPRPMRRRGERDFPSRMAAMSPVLFKAPERGQADPGGMGKAPLREVLARSRSATAPLRKDSAVRRELFR